MLPLVPFIASHWVFEFSIVEMFAENAIDHAEGDVLPISGLEIRFPVQPPQELPPTPLFIRRLFEHFLNERRTLRVNKHLLIPLICVLVMQIPQGRRARPPPLLALGSQSPFHVYAFMVILQLCLASQDHE